MLVLSLLQNVDCDSPVLVISCPECQVSPRNNNLLLVHVFRHFELQMWSITILCSWICSLVFQAVSLFSSSKERYFPEGGKGNYVCCSKGLLSEIYPFVLKKEMRIYITGILESVPGKLLSLYLTCFLVSTSA